MARTKQTARKTAAVASASAVDPHVHNALSRWQLSSSLPPPMGDAPPPPPSLPPPNDNDATAEDGGAVAAGAAVDRPDAATRSAGREECRRRLRSPPQKRTEDSSPPRVAVKNASATDLNVRKKYEIVLDTRRANGVGTCASLGPVPAGEEITVDLPWHDAEGHQLRLNTKGIVWEGGGAAAATAAEGGDSARIITAEPGNRYVATEDAENPPLSDGELRRANELILWELELGTPHAEVWPEVAKRFGGGRSAAQLADVHEPGSVPSWRELYRPPRVEHELCTSTDLAAALVAGGSAVVDCYWRALDRYPGGNADFHTVLYRFQSEDRSVHCFEYSNWDGSHHRVSYIPGGLDTSSLPDLCADLLKLPRDSECTITDEISQDQEEYNSEWSSQEILVHIPRRWSTESRRFFSESTQATVFTFLLVNARLRLFPRDVQSLIIDFATRDRSVLAVALRLHRRSIPGPNQFYWAARRNPPQDAIPPSEEQVRVLEGSAALVGMGRVNTFSDAGDGEAPCRAASYGRLDARFDRGGQDLPYIQPLYFRNV